MQESVQYIATVTLMRAQIAVDPVMSLHQSWSVACKWSVRHQKVVNRATTVQNKKELNPIKMSYTHSDTCKQGNKHTKGRIKVANV